MKKNHTFRLFLRTLVFTTAALAIVLTQTSCTEKKSGSTFLKSLIVNNPTEESLGEIKAAGFDGVEIRIAGPDEAANAGKIAEKLDLQIHSVLHGWADFNSDDPDKVQSSFDAVVNSLDAAKACGAEVILLVPGRVSGLAMPEAWEFQVEFDERTGHITSVAENDNDRYSDYISAHNKAYDSFREAIGKLIPHAERTGVVIAVENVWSNLFVDARHTAHFIDSFDSDLVRMYFDIGNHVKYSPPEDWIRILGKRIIRCHVKDFKLNPDGHGGNFVNIRDGSVNWPVVLKALRGAGYAGWMTIEGSDDLSMQERSRRLDLIIAGQ